MAKLARLSRKNKKVIRYVRRIGYDAVRGGITFQAWTVADKATYDKYKEIDLAGHMQATPCTPDEFVLKFSLKDNPVPERYRKLWERFSGVQPRYILRNGLLSFGNYGTRGGMPYEPERFICNIISNARIIGTNEISFKLPKEEIEKTDYYTDPKIEYIVPSLEVLAGIAKVFSVLEVAITAKDKEYTMGVQAAADRLNHYVKYLSILGLPAMSKQVESVLRELRKNPALEVRHMVYGDLPALY